MGNVYSGSPKASESRGFGKGFGFRTKDNVNAELMQTPDGCGGKVLSKPNDDDVIP